MIESERERERSGITIQLIQPATQPPIHPASQPARKLWFLSRFLITLLSLYHSTPSISPFLHYSTLHLNPTLLTCSCHKISHLPLNLSSLHPSILPPPITPSV